MLHYRAATEPGAAVAERFAGLVRLAFRSASATSAAARVTAPVTTLTPSLTARAFSVSKMRTLVFTKGPLSCAGAPYFALSVASAADSTLTTVCTNQGHSGQKLQVNADLLPAGDFSEWITVLLKLCAFFRAQISVKARSRLFCPGMGLPMPFPFFGV